MIPDGASTRNEVAIASKNCLTHQHNAPGALQLGFPLIISHQTHNCHGRHCHEYNRRHVMIITGGTVMIITGGTVMNVIGGTVMYTTRCTITTVAMCVMKKWFVSMKIIKTSNDQGFCKWLTPFFLIYSFKNVFFWGYKLDMILKNRFSWGFGA